MMAQWEDVYREVVYRLRKIQQNAPTQLWQNVLEEVIQRWQSRQDLREGKINSEVTVKVGVATEEVAQKALERIRQFIAQFGTIEDENRRVVMLGQVYRKDGNISVLLRLRIVTKTAKSRSKFVATENDVKSMPSVTLPQPCHNALPCHICC
jgi:GTP cyclohydrolase III